MPTGRRTCFLGSTNLGRCCLGNIAVQLRDSTVHPRGIAFLPRGVTCLGINTGLSGPKPCRAPDCLEKDHTLCLRSAVLWGRLGTACLGDLTLRKSAIYWGSLGTACLGNLALCLGKSAVSWGRLGTACLRRQGTACLGDCTLCLGEQCYLLGKPGKYLAERAHSLPGKECCLPGGLGGCLPGRSCLGEEHYLPERLEGKP